MTSQKDTVLAELRKGLCLSRRDIRALNINSETAAILELRRDGHNIDSAPCRNKKTGARYVRYVLYEKGIRRKF